MSRLVTVRYLGARAAGAGAEDKAVERIAKYIPAEVLAFFSIWTQAVAMLPWPNAVLPLEVTGYLIGLVVTPVYFTRFFPNDPLEARAAHRWLSTLAFGVHGYTISGTVLPSGWFHPSVALLGTALITLASAIYIPNQR